ncbi:MAG: transporter, permease family protein [Proteobacteria bacterium]|nr:transporter, permease family protein [Pseudomonadota bacterium]
MRGQVNIRSVNWRRLSQVARAFGASEVGRKATMLFCALLALLLGVSLFNVVNSYVGRDFMTAIAERDSRGFVLQGTVYVGVFTASTIVAVIYRFTEERLGLVWREWLTRWLVTAYLEDRTYYRLKEHGGIENPDERIADDVRAFTATTLSFVLMVLNGTITVAAFSGVIWSISPLLFAVTVGYAVIGSFLAIKLGRPLIALNYSQLDREANFRSALIHVWENAEAIALARREERLTDRLLRRVDEVMGNFDRIIRVNRNLGFFTTGYNNLIQIIPAFIVAPLFIRGEVEFGVITQAAMAFAHLVGAFSLIVTQFQSISSFAAIIARIGSLAEVIANTRSRRTCGIRICHGGEDLSFKDLSLSAPGDSPKPLLSGLSLTVRPGSRLLVTGPSEHARLALFKAAAGLWTTGSGKIVWPTGESVFFLTERPYLLAGSLREALLGYARQRSVPDEAIVDTLSHLGLNTALARIGGLEAAGEWHALLSLSEQQLFSFARVLLADARFVFLDRACSALSPQQRKCVMAELYRRSIACIHYGQSEDEYDAVLDLAGDGTWFWTARPTTEAGQAAKD